MNKQISFFVVGLLLMMALSAYASATNVSIASGAITISGPSQVAEGSNFTYTVNVEHIFTDYQIVMIPTGYNLTGASPVNPQYINGTFAPITFNMTAPTVPTTLLLFFQIKASLGGSIFYYNETVPVNVVKYTLLHAVIKNPSNFSVNGLNVSFYVNGKYIGATNVNIDANSTQNVTYKWLSGTLSPGIYTVTININNSIVRFVNGSAYSLKIQSGNPNMNYIYAGIIAFLLIIIVVIFIGSYYSRRNKPKWKK